jgi:hypothetical protein
MGVTWAFGVLPLITTLLGFIYVAFVIAETRVLRLPVWKDRILPKLAYGLNEKTQKEVRHAIDGGYVKNFEKSIRVRLEDDHEDDWLIYKLRRN